MNKKTTDRIINRWILRFLFGPVSLLSLSAFVIGYCWPGVATVVQTVAQWLGLHHIIEIRTLGADFESAAYVYWVTFWVTLPLNLGWLHFVGVREKLFVALRTIGLANLSSGAWNPQKYTLKGGYARFFFLVVLTGSIFFVQITTAHEPSYCKGCETSSVVGFILINWAGTHLMLIASYIACSYFALWKSVYKIFGEKNG